MIVKHPVQLPIKGLHTFDFLDLRQEPIELYHHVHLQLQLTFSTTPILNDVYGCEQIEYEC